MNTFIAFSIWCVLFVLAWPLALLVLLLFPLVWLLALPFRLTAVVVNAFLGLLRAILTLPARLLGGGDRKHGCRCQS
jgi:hypothetical protein